ncbi:hypothetical protein HOD61_01775 [archaeon]|jgi:DNA repair protein RadB|nr:hypothetical protein [archaeon]
MKIKSGNLDLDKFLEGGYNGISALYGLPTSGKSCLALMAVLEQLKEGKNVFFLDVKNDFNLNRLEQISGNKLNNLNHLFVLKIKNFKHQQDKVKELILLTEKKPISLIVIDGFNFYYRTLYNSRPNLAKAMLNSQLKQLKELSKTIPIILTNDVFENFKTKIVQMLGNNTIEWWIDNKLRLDVEETFPNRLNLLKPKKSGYFEFNIIERGIEEVKSKRL